MEVMRPHINLAELQHTNSRRLHRDNAILILENAFHHEELASCPLPVDWRK